MRISKYIILFFLCSNINLYAQEIKGQIFSASTGLPLANVNITSKKSVSGTTSDKLGKFTLTWRTRPKDTIVFSHLGYISKKLTIKALKKGDIEVFLVQGTQKLNEVRVLSANRPKRNNTLKFRTLSSLKKGLYSFATIAFKDSIYVIGGDESVTEDLLKKGMIRNPSNPSNPSMNLNELIQNAWGAMNWRHYSGKIQVYDIASDKWKLSDVEIRNRAYHNAQLNGNTLYIYGGKRLVRRGKFEYLDNTIEVIDLSTGSVLVDKTNPHQASALSSVLYEDNLILAGGAIKEDSKGKKAFSNKLHEYDLASGYWYEVGHLPENGNIRGALVGSKYYAFIWSKELPGALYSYNLETGSWTYEIKVPIEPESPAMTSVDNVIYFFDNNRIIAFDTNDNSLKSYKINLMIEGADIVAVNDVLYIIGGYRVNEYSVMPSSGMYSIQLSELDKTKFIQLGFID